MPNFSTKRKQMLLSSYQRYFSPIVTASSWAPPPQYLQLMLTYDCNMDCYFCNQSQMRRGKQAELNLEEIKKIDDNLDFAKTPRIYLFGGEPTTNPDFIPILNFLAGQKYPLYLTTNGKYRGWINRETVAALTEIVVSINKQNYDHIAKTMEEIKKTSKSSNIVVNCPLSSQHLNDIKKVVNVALGNGADSLVLQHLTIDRDKIKEKQINLERLKEMKKIIENLPLPVYFYPSVGNLDAYYTNPNYPKQSYCLAPWLKMEVLPTGKVIPCKWLSSDLEMLGGNARNLKLSKIWNGSVYRNFRKRIHRRGTFPDKHCFRCCYRSYK